jgi:hypothetical protein
VAAGPQVNQYKHFGATRRTSPPVSNRAPMDDSDFDLGLTMGGSRSPIQAGTGHRWGRRSRSRPTQGGGCSPPHACDPVNIPHDIENRGERPESTRKGLRRSAALLRLRRKSRNQLGSPSQGGHTGSNPVGTTQVRRHIRASRERVAPHWHRGVHEAVTARCSVTRAKKQVDST